MLKESDRNEAGHNWHSLTGEKSLQQLQSTMEGLSSDSAEQRFHEYGPNRLKAEKKRPAWKRFLDQFRSILIIILLIAGVASLLLQQPVDAVAIFAVVLVVALLGFIQEGKAEKALDSLKNMLSPSATVLRNGERRELSAESLVPGDIVMMASGDRVPADVRLLDTRRFRTQEAALTGESEPVDKISTALESGIDLADRNNMAYAGTLVVQGQATALVVETASDTEIGRISKMLHSVEKIQTPLLQHLDSAGKTLAFIIIAVAALTGAFGVLVHGNPLPQAFMASVALAVASIPEGLPAIVTIVLALGVQAMARRNAIIRHLPAVETLGATSIIFTDKTGTLTRNEMTARTIVLANGEIGISGIGYKPEGKFSRHDSSTKQNGGASLIPDEDALLTHFLTAASLCNDASSYEEDGSWQISGDPTEAALVVAAGKAGLEAAPLRRHYPRLDIIPFESEHKYMATLNNNANDSEARHIHVKGAPDRILDMCSQVRDLDGDIPLDKELWQRHIDELSSRGLRVLAVAEKIATDMETVSREDAENNLSLLGLIGLLDPPREEAVKAIKVCLQAGIRPVMVTGDHALTARAIGEQVGLKRTDMAITGAELAAMSDTEMRDHINDSDVYARAAPEHKLRLVQAAQAQGAVCAMTGDGVNDAPALRRADVGVAMGIQGTEVAREAADMVLMDDNFASIVSAVEEGRKVYDNIRKTILFILPSNGGQGAAIAVAILSGTLLPVTPVQALWVNMIIAVTLGLALGFEAGERNLMQRPPRDPGAPLLDMFLLWRVVFVSVLLLAGVYGMFFWILEFEAEAVEVARAGAVNMLVMGSVAYLLNSRFLVNSSLSWQGITGSRPVLISIALVTVFQLLWTYTGAMQTLFGSAGLALHHWGMIILGSIVIFLLVEAEKTLFRRKGGNNRLRSLAAD